MGRTAFLLLFALVLGGTSAASPFRAPNVVPRVGVLAVGDFGEGGSRERGFGQAIRRFEVHHPAQLFVPLGDNDYTQSASAFRRNWVASFGWLRRARVGVSGVLGNHDVRLGGGSYELATLGMPAAYYTRTVGDIEFFMLDSNNVDTEQTQWLERELAASTAPWRIAAFHHPAYACGLHMGDEDVQRSWVPLFERYHVQLVLSGHDHNYQRFAAQNGVVYVVDGGGGHSLYPLRGCPDDYPPRVRARLAFGFLYLVVRDDRIDGYVIRFSGRGLDHFTVGP